jgi:hypothetical protein
MVRLVSQQFAVERPGFVETARLMAPERAGQFVVQGLRPPPAAVARLIEVL